MADFEVGDVVETPSEYIGRVTYVGIYYVNVYLTGYLPDLLEPSGICRLFNLDPNSSARNQSYYKSTVKKIKNAELLEFVLALGD